MPETESSEPSNKPPEKRKSTKRKRPTARDILASSFREIAETKSGVTNRYITLV